MNILIVTVQYRQHEKTYELIDSISRYAAPFCYVKLIIVDNAQAEDGAIDFSSFASSLPFEIDYIANSNTGYFPGLNKGIKSVSNIDIFNFIIVCNNDIRFDANFFQNLNANRFIVGKNTCLVPNIYGLSGEKQNPQYEFRIPFIKRLILTVLFLFPSAIGFYIHKTIHSILGRKIMQGRIVYSYDVDGLKEVFLPLGAIFIFSPVTYHNLNELPEQSFLYGEEMLLRQRLTEIGGCFKISQFLNVQHSESSTTKELPTLTKWKMQRKAFFKYMKFYLSGK